MALEYAWDNVLAKWVPLQLTTGAATAKYCTMGKTSPQSIPNGGIFTKVAPFNSAITGNNPAWGDYTTGEITIPATGWYGAQAIVEAAPGTGGVFKCSIFINGSGATYLVMGEAARSAAYADNVIWSGGASRMFNAGDKVSLHVSNGFTAAVNVVDATLTLFQQDILVDPAQLTQDDADILYVKKTGDVMTGPLQVDKTLSLYRDATRNDASSVSWITGDVYSWFAGVESGQESWLLNNTLASGNALEVDLTTNRVLLVGDPLHARGAATKQYVDNAIGNGGGGGGGGGEPVTLTTEYCSMGHGAGQTIPKGGTNTKLLFDSTGGNRSEWGNLNGDITVPSSGWYTINFKSAANPGVGVIQYAVRVNGLQTTGTHQETSRSALSQTILVSMSVDVYIASGGKVAAYAANHMDVDSLHSYVLSVSRLVASGGGGGGFTQTEADLLYLKKNGESVNGDFHVAAIDGTVQLEADGRLDFKSYGGWFQFSGGDLDAGGYKVTGLDEPVSDNDAATKGYVDANGGGGGEYLPLTGGTLNGQLIINDNIEVNGNSYVRDWLSVDGMATISQGIETSSILMGFDEIVISTNDVNIRAAQVAMQSDSSLALGSPGQMTLFSDQPIKITKLTGLNVPQRITNVDTPTGPTDVATKGYVDARTPPIIELSAAAPVPDGTPAGTVIIRTVT